MRQFSNLYRVLFYVNLFINAVFCAVIPPVLLALAGKWLCGRFHWNRVVIAVLLLFGIILGLFSMISCIRKTVAAMEQNTGSESINLYRIHNDSLKK